MSDDEECGPFCQMCKDEDEPEVQDTADEHDYDDELRGQFVPSEE